MCSDVFRLLRHRIFGVLSGGYERFFQRSGTPIDVPSRDLPPFIPDADRMTAAAQRHNSTFYRDYKWPDA